MQLGLGLGSKFAPSGIVNGEPVVVGAPLDGMTGITGAWSFSRDMLTSFGAGTRYTNSGTAIITFEDQSGNNRDFSDGGITTRRPTETTAGPNSRLCADFDGSTDLLLTAVATSQLISVSSGAIVLSGIVDAATLNDANPFFNHGLCGTLDTNVILGVRRSLGVTLGYSGNNDGSNDQTADTAISNGTAYVFMWRHHGGTLYWSVNGGTEISISSGNTTDLSAVFLLAAQSNLTDMKIFEVFTTSDGSQTAAIAAAIANMKSHIGA